MFGKGMGGYYVDGICSLRELNNMWENTRTNFNGGDVVGESEIN